MYRMDVLWHAYERCRVNDGAPGVRAFGTYRISGANPVCPNGPATVPAKIRARVATEVPEARVLVFGAPPIPGLGTSACFELMVEAIGDVDYDVLQKGVRDIQDFQRTSCMSQRSQ